MCSCKYSICRFTNTCDITPSRVSRNGLYEFSSWFPSIRLSLGWASSSMTIMSILIPLEIAMKVATFHAETHWDFIDIIFLFCSFRHLQFPQFVFPISRWWGEYYGSNRWKTNKVSVEWVVDVELLVYMYESRDLFRRSWWACTCCFPKMRYTLGFLKFCKQVGHS